MLPRHSVADAGAVEARCFFLLEIDRAKKVETKRRHVHLWFKFFLAY